MHVLILHIYVHTHMHIHILMSSKKCTLLYMSTAVPASRPETLGEEVFGAHTQGLAAGGQPPGWCWSPWHQSLATESGPSPPISPVGGCWAGWVLESAPGQSSLHVALSVPGFSQELPCTP